ncbi:MAG TPA: hypothetical protein VFX44_06315 [Solirubrobacterales bacterium]|nr:hypothetical protein [Solirubrobacterales bacterium]
MDKRDEEVKEGFARLETQVERAKAKSDEQFAKVDRRFKRVDEQFTSSSAFAARSWRP